jgi:hypothetical protein
MAKMLGSVVGYSLVYLNLHNDVTQLNAMSSNQMSLLLSINSLNIEYAYQTTSIGHQGLSNIERETYHHKYQMKIDIMDCSLFLTSGTVRESVKDNGCS